MLDDKIILKVIISFYELATKDFIIGYHFRNIQNFDEHIPHIARFWQIQLLGAPTRGESFDLIKKHLPLMINQGQLARWIFLFKQNLDQYELSDKDKNIWINKVEWFADKMKNYPSMIR